MKHVGPRKLTVAPGTADPANCPVIMLALLIVLLGPPTPTSNLQTRCLDSGHAPSCDRWLSPRGRAAPEADLRRACAFEAPFSCGLLADRKPRWASADQRLEWRMIACRADVRACETLAAEMDDTGVSEAIGKAARHAVERAGRRWPEVWYAWARETQNPAAQIRALSRGCDGKDGRACRELAWTLERGDGMPVDLKRARAAGDKACAQGDDTLCLHRLRHRQDAEDWAGIRRICRRGDALSCAAQDARACLRGDAKACRRAEAVPPGACPTEPGACQGTPSLPPGSTHQCEQIDRCERSRQRQRRHARQWLTQAANDCAVDAARLRIRVGRSGDVFSAKSAPKLAGCFKDRIMMMRLPVVASPSLLRVRIITRDGRRRVQVQVSGKRGQPVPK